MASDRRERWKFVCYLAVVLPVLVRCEGNQALRYSPISSDKISLRLRGNRLHLADFFGTDRALPLSLSLRSWQRLLLLPASLAARADAKLGDQGAAAKARFTLLLSPPLAHPAASRGPFRSRLACSPCPRLAGSSVDPHAAPLGPCLRLFVCPTKEGTVFSQVPVLCAVVLFALTAARPVRVGRLFHGLSAALPQPAAHARKSPLRKLFSPQRTFGMK
ncbi:hypothetical protein MRX96_014896 [Rhipicephalus microplus]